MCDVWSLVISFQFLNEVLVQEYGGSFQGFIEAFQRRNNYDGTALQLAEMVTDTFPSFRDEHWFEGRRGLYS
jgi:Potential Queuosine, Q, salvage protein family